MNKQISFINQYLNQCTMTKISSSSLTLLVGIISCASSAQAFEMSITRYNQFSLPINGFSQVFTNPFGDNPNLDLLSVTSPQFPFIQVTNNNSPAVTLNGLTFSSIAPNSPYTITYNFKDNPDKNGFLITQYTVNLRTGTNAPTQTASDPLSLISIFTEGPGYLGYYATVPNFRTVLLQAPGNRVYLYNNTGTVITPTISVINIPQYSSSLDSSQFPPGQKVVLNPGVLNSINALNSTTVPEPSTIPEIIAALGIGAVLKRKLG